LAIESLIAAAPGGTEAHLFRTAAGARSSWQCCGCEELVARNKASVDLLGKDAGKLPVVGLIEKE
jgi:hypothetical protein